MSSKHFRVAQPRRHASGGYIGATPGSGYIAGTHSKTWLGAFVASNVLLLTALLATSFGMLSGLGGFVSYLLSAPLEIIAVVNAGLLALWTSIKVWSAALWGWLKLAATGLVFWVAYQIAFALLEYAVDALPLASEVRAILF